MKKKSQKIKHAVILVNYNGWQDTIVCVNSIKKSKDMPHIIVVDNASINESVKELKKAFPDLDLIEAGANRGFSAGNNLGIKKALKIGAEVIHILNNDTEVDPNLFFRAFRYVAGENRIAGGKIYYAKGYEYHEAQKGKGNILWYAGGYMDWTSVTAHHRGVDEVDHGQYEQMAPVDFVTGCYMAIPRQVLERIGYFDESLFLYLEDADLSLRAKSLGVEMFYNPHLILYHRNGSSTGAGSNLVDYYMTRNRFVIGRRFGKSSLFLALLREAIVHNWTSSIRRRAFFDYLTGQMGERYLP